MSEEKDTENFYPVESTDYYKRRAEELREEVRRRAREAGINLYPGFQYREMDISWVIETGYVSPEFIEEVMGLPKVNTQDREPKIKIDIETET